MEDAKTKEDLRKRVGKGLGHMLDRGKGKMLVPIRDMPGDD